MRQVFLVMALQCILSSFLFSMENYLGKDVVFHSKNNILQKWNLQNEYEKKYGCDENFLNIILNKAAGQEITGGTAMDLGSGTGGWSRHLLQLNTWQLYAVDYFKSSLDHLEQSLSLAEKKRIRLVHKDFRKIDWPSDIDLILANDSLGFIPCDDLMKVLDSIRTSLRTGGIFAASFWGENDVRNYDEKLCTLSKTKIHTIFKDHYDELYFDSKEGDSKNLDNQIAHWHTIHIIVKKN